LTINNDKVTGGCLCGEIRYESDLPPYLVGHCHCKMCQKGVGNIYSTAAFFKIANFRYLHGIPKWFNSDGANRGFCAQCGSPIGFQRHGFEDEYCAIWLGTLDRPGDFKPTVQWHLESKIPWVEMNSNLRDATPRAGAIRYDVGKEE